MSLNYYKFDFILTVILLFCCANKNADTTAWKTVAMEKVRQPAVAGAFYERNEVSLKKHIHSLLNQAKKTGKTSLHLTAAVVPHAGYVFSGKCAASVYSLISSEEYDRVIILAPYHGRGPGQFFGISLPAPDIIAYKTPLGNIPVDREVCKRLKEKKGFMVVSGADRYEHSIEVQIPFLQETIGNFKLVPLLCGVISDNQINYFAKAIKPYLNKRTLIIASSDFTHYGPNYGFIPFRKEIKENLYKWLRNSTEIIASLDTEGFMMYCKKTDDTICGRIPVKLLMMVLKETGYSNRGKILDYYTSGDIMGDYNNSVSYAAIGFTTDSIGE